ncbi:hypothetical protein [Desulfallas thermosapovorans]|uniref:Uncharacterized protein n=1 Tax=Desulfallas thermosapovorans DSM 6562 TaxID=1121431 RepID=A0A5S4ZQQ5_9FIRM|nr:hypothetical protein [Desulfallas thermosapovorans]TYO93878.1 hypothetical protein LX24_02562 [Desulfallas thermosapovorans DSM 6562]
MDQFYQLQQQIQRLRQEVNSISQMTSQLQQFEQNNAAQLQRLQQQEANATQQLQRIQQICGQINNDLNSVSNAAQQASQSLAQSFTPLGTGGYSQQFGTFGNQFTTGAYSQNQHYQPNYISSTPFQQQRFGTQYTGSYAPVQSGYAQSFNQSFGGGYVSPNMMSYSYTQGYGYGGQQQNQSFAENQQISQQAQQALANRMNQNLSNLNNQFSTTSNIYSGF